MEGGSKNGHGVDVVNGVDGVNNGVNAAAEASSSGSGSPSPFRSPNTYTALLESIQMLALDPSPKVRAHSTVKDTRATSPNVPLTPSRKGTCVPTWLCKGGGGQRKIVACRCRPRSPIAF